MDIYVPTMMKAWRLLLAALGTYSSHENMPQGGFFFLSLYANGLTERSAPDYIPMHLS